MKLTILGLTKNEMTILDEKADENINFVYKKIFAL